MGTRVLLWNLSLLAAIVVLTLHGWWGFSLLLMFLFGMETSDGRGDER